MPKNNKILLVEDDPAQILMYSEKFSQAGYQVISAGNPKEVIPMVEKEMPALIMLDIVIGWPLTSSTFREVEKEGKAERMEGIKILKKLKENPETKDIPVVLFTNLDKQYLKEAGKKLGAADFIVKVKNTPTQILERIKQILG